MSRLPSVYFYCRNEDGNLQEDVVTLAEGLRELGVPFYANCDYWRESPEGPHLLRHIPDVGPDDCDIVVVSYTWPYWIRMGTFDLVRRPLPDGLFKPGRRYRAVYMDHHDGHRTVSWEDEYRQFDLILRAKLNGRAWSPPNMRPWALGLNARILRATRHAPPFRDRRTVLLKNYGASHPYPHGTRTISQRSFEPSMGALLPIDATVDDLGRAPTDAYARLMWEQTGHRYSDNYYARLRESQAVACFCGELIPPMPYRDPEQYLVGGNKAKLRRGLYDMLALLDRRPPRSVQWDSFRFWEALAAGCAAFNLQLDRYGVRLPVMPQNWTHYIGVNLERPSEAIERLHADPGLLERVATQGREWALEHYSPVATAARLLQLAGWPVPTHQTIPAQKAHA